MKRLISTLQRYSPLAWAVSLLLTLTVTFAPLPAQPQIWLAQAEPTAEQPATPEPQQTDSSTDQSASADRSADTNSQPTTDRQSEASQSEAGPYDMEAIKAFNRALYGS